MVLGVLGGDAYLVDVGIVVTHLVVVLAEKCNNINYRILTGLLGSHHLGCNRQSAQLQCKK